MRCIQDRWDHEEGSRSPCSCPECGNRFAIRPRLIENTTLADLVRDTPALKRARTWTKTGSPLCGRHNRSLDVYCCTDEKVICQVCASAEHTGHTFGFVSRERRRNQVKHKQNHKFWLTFICFVTDWGDSSAVNLLNMVVYEWTNNFCFLCHK